MKIYTNIKYLLLFLILTSGCKRDPLVSSEFAQAYIRFVMIDAPGQGASEFYLDNKVNANGDSIIHNPDGSIYQPDPNQATTATVSYPSGGWTDNSDLNFSGTYGFNNKPGSTFATYPNPTDRIALAPIINNLNFYNWASLPSGRHQLTFYSIISTSLFGNPISVKGNSFFNEPVDLEGGTIQTFFMINKSFSKAYNTESILVDYPFTPPLSNIKNVNYYPIYNYYDGTSYFSEKLYDVVTVKDHPANLPKFKDSSAYVRFLNFSPYTTDQSLNQFTESIDVYLQPEFGQSTDAYYANKFGETYAQNFIDSVGEEVPVAMGLNRFTSTVDAPFYEIDMSAHMRINKTTGNPDTAKTQGKPRVPMYFRVVVYKAGQTKAQGFLPLAFSDWLATFTKFPVYRSGGYDSFIPDGTSHIDSWLVRSDGTNFHPAICTILLSVNQALVHGRFGNNQSHILGWRSNINYQRTGINNVFFPK